MTKNERIAYLNKRLHENESFVYCGPKTLFKYRPFDEYSFEMLNSNTLFLCPAMKLDDETECDTSVNMSDLVELETNNLKRVCLEQIIQMIKPYCSEEVYEEVRQKIHRASYGDGTIRSRFLLDIANDIQEAAPGIDTAPLVNWIRNIPEKLDEPSIKPQIEMLIKIAMDAKEKMGICALCEDNDNEYMWEKYAKDSSGYCIEYELDDYEFNKDLFPVIYDADRKTNIVMSIVANFIGQLITSFSNNQIQADASQYLRLFVSKYPEWEYQNEWRILGNAGTTLKAPKIRRIIIGKNASQEDRNKMKEFCVNNSIEYKENEVD